MALLAGGIMGLSVVGRSRPRTLLIAGFAGALIGFGISFTQPWGQQRLPIQSYGTMMLIGFLSGVYVSARRSEQIGVEKKHCMDIGVYGVAIGLAGARILHIVSNWHEFTPFLETGFSTARVIKMFKIWEAGLDFFGAFVTVIPFTYWYSRRYNIPALPMVDMACPALILGQAFGRVGCFLFGCCYGKTCDLPWKVQFPPDSPPYDHQLRVGEIAEGALLSAPVHPTQLYAAIGCLLTFSFLYAYWPRRPYDGFILSLLLIMTGSLRFFEELLRNDVPPTFASIPWLTNAHFFALGAVVTGILMMLYFRQHRTLFKPAFCTAGA